MRHKLIGEQRPDSGPSVLCRRRVERVASVVEEAMPDSGVLDDVVADVGRLERIGDLASLIVRDHLVVLAHEDEQATCDVRRASQRRLRLAEGDPVVGIQPP